MRKIFGPPSNKTSLLRKYGYVAPKAPGLAPDPYTLVCDGQCSKAYGINGRPRILLSKKDEDDFVYVPDDLLPKAPPPGSTLIVGCNGQQKPSGTGLNAGEEHSMTEWCKHECERTNMVYGAHTASLRAPNMNAPEPNVPRT